MNASSVRLPPESGGTWSAMSAVSPRACQKPPSRTQLAIERIEGPKRIGGGPYGASTGRRKMRISPPVSDARAVAISGSPHRESI